MNNEKTLSVEFTKSQVDNLVEFIEWNFIDIIRKDEEVDNINYIIDMMEALKKLRAVAEKFDNEPIKEQDCDNIDECEIVSGFIKEANN